MMINYMSDDTAKTVVRAKNNETLQSTLHDLREQYRKAWCNHDDEDCEMIELRMRAIQKQITEQR